MVVEKIKALWSEMPWQAKLIMVCIGMGIGSSTLFYRGFVWHAASWHWNGLGDEGGFDLHLAYLKTPFAQISGGVLLLSILVGVLTGWLAGPEE